RLSGWRRTRRRRQGLHGSRRGRCALDPDRRLSGDRSRARRPRRSRAIPRGDGGSRALNQRDAAPSLVAGHLTHDGRAVRLYFRGPDGLKTETATFQPFLLAADRSLVVDISGLVDLNPLEGQGALCWLARFESWGYAVGARDRCRERQTAFLFLADPMHQYLLLSGRTSFGGLRFADLRRLALDIEVVTSTGFEF